jgi:hypothetical protein
VDAPRFDAGVAQVALGYHSKCTDRRQHATLSAIDFINARALSNQVALAASREIKILREHVARVAIVIAIAVARSTTAAATSNA